MNAKQIVGNSLVTLFILIVALLIASAAKLNGNMVNQTPIFVNSVMFNSINAKEKPKRKLNKKMSTADKLRKELNELTIEQYKVLLTTFAKGRAFNYEYTMTAIAWQESTFGKYMMNLSDPSFGVFHNLITSVINRTDTNDSPWNRSRVAERLIMDYDFSFSQSLGELKYWENYWTSKKVPRVWSHTIRSYNAGYKHTNGKAYLRMIKLRIKILKEYVKEHDDQFKAIMRYSYN